MAIPSIFSEQGGQAIASYNYLDIVQGVGYLTLYGGDYDDSGTGKYAISPNTFYSTLGTHQTVGAAAFDIDFDIELGRTITFEGQALINIPLRMQNAGVQQVTATVYIRKYSGGVESEIVNDTCSTPALLNWGANQPWCLAIKLAVPKTVFKKGDILRVTYTCPGYAGKTIDWFHDPMNRSTINGSAYSVETSQFKVNMPVKIDL